MFYLLVVQPSHFFCAAPTRPQLFDSTVYIQRRFPSLFEKKQKKRKKHGTRRHKFQLLRCALNQGKGMCQLQVCNKFLTCLFQSDVEQAAKNCKPDTHLVPTYPFIIFSRNATASAQNAANAHVPSASKTVNLSRMGPQERRSLKVCHHLFIFALDSGRLINFLQSKSRFSRPGSRSWRNLRNSAQP